MNDETALKELLSMSRIYNSRGQIDKAEECMILAEQIEQRLSLQSRNLSSSVEESQKRPALNMPNRVLN
jgi:hypothetical protein